MADSSLPQSSKNASGKKAISGAEVILLILLVIVGMGLWVWVERVFNERFHHLEPNQEQLAANRGVPQKQDELARLQNERTEVQKQLIGEQLKQLQQGATVKTLTSLHPNLAKIGTDSTASVPPETLKAYQEALTHGLVAESVVASLNGRVMILKKEVDEATAQLERQKQTATDEFHRSKASYLLLKPGVIFTVTLVAVLVLLFIGQFLVALVTKNRMSSRPGALPILVVVGAVFILFGYQAFEVAGAALVGVALLLILLTKIDWPEKPKGAIQK